MVYQQHHYVQKPLREWAEVKMILGYIVPSQSACHSHLKCPAFLFCIKLQPFSHLSPMLNIPPLTVKWLHEDF